MTSQSQLMPSALGGLKKAPRGSHPSSPVPEAAAPPAERPAPGPSDAAPDGDDVGGAEQPPRQGIRVGPGKTRRTYYLNSGLVADLERTVARARADAFVHREPSKNEVYEAVIRTGLDRMPDVIERLRTGQVDKEG